MDFSAAVQAQLAGTKVRRGRLVEFDFLSGRMGLWNGARRLTTADGKIWEGMFGLGKIDGIQQAIGGAAPEMKFTVSGVDSGFALKAIGEAAEYFNRSVTVYSQFFDEDWGVLDAPFAETWGIMRSFIPSKESTDDGFVRTVTLTAETPFGSTKRRPRFSYATDTDQKQRFPGDRAMERVAGIEAKLIQFGPT